MDRIPEPELMLDDAQAEAYAKADFKGAHDRYPILFVETFPNPPKTALVLDLGCGPCDITMRFARANPGWTFHAVDGSPAMLKRAPRHERIQLIEGYIPGAPIPAKGYDIIISSSLLHHLPDPQALWTTVRQHSRPGTMVFVVDLRRPATLADLESLVAKYVGNEPEVYCRDFRNSLHAAFTTEEVRAQTKDLPGLTVKTISDRHLMVAGRA